MGAGFHGGFGKTFGSGKRIVPGKDGHATGGNSTKLGKNILKAMGVSRGRKWTGYQAQHIIPVELINHPVIQKIGMYMDDASNGLFLRIPDSNISTMSRHRGYHAKYNAFVKQKLDELDIEMSSFQLQKSVHSIQTNLRRMQQSGIVIYEKQGATIELLEKTYKRYKEEL